MSTPLPLPSHFVATKKLFDGFSNYDLCDGHVSGSCAVTTAESGEAFTDLVKGRQGRAGPAEIRT